MCHLTIMRIMSNQRTTLETKVTCLGRSITWSMAATLRDVVVVSMRPRALLPAFEIIRTAIHGFLSRRCFAVQPFASLSFFMTEAMSIMLPANNTTTVQSVFGQEKFISQNNKSELNSNKLGSEINLSATSPKRC